MNKNLMNYGGYQTNKPRDNGSMIVAQISGFQTQDVPFITPYGFYSMPPVKSVWCIFPLRGNDNDMVGFGNDYVRRPLDLKEADVCLFNTISKAKIVLRTTGKIEIYAPDDIDINTDKNINMIAQENINIKAMKDVNIEGVDNINFISKKITAEASEELILTTDVIDINVTSTGTLDCETFTWTGDVLHGGGILKSNGIGLSTHTHTSSLPGSPTSPPN